MLSGAIVAEGRRAARAASVICRRRRCQHIDWRAVFLCKPDRSATADLGRRMTQFVGLPVSWLVKLCGSGR